MIEHTDDPEIMTIDQYLIENPSASYTVEAKDDSLRQFGILKGDMVIVERGREARKGNIVLGTFGDEYNLLMYDYDDQKLSKPLLRNMHIEAVAVGIVRKLKV